MSVALADEDAVAAGAHAAPDGAGRDHHLVEAARRGDRAAFAQLHERYAPMVHGLALARVRRDDAPDIVQEVFLCAWRGLDSLRDGQSIGPWLARIACNLAAEVHRRNVMIAERPVGRMPDRIDRDAQRDEAVRILSIIQSLPVTYSQTLVLRLVEGLTGPQIAACTGMTPGSVRVNLHRGMQMLRSRLDQEKKP